MPVCRIIRLGVMNSLLCHLNRQLSANWTNQGSQRALVTFRDSSMEMGRLRLENSESFGCKFDLIYSGRWESSSRRKMEREHNSPILYLGECQQKFSPRNWVSNQDRWWHRVIREWVDPIETSEQLEREISCFFSSERTIRAAKTSCSVLSTC